MSSSGLIRRIRRTPQPSTPVLVYSTLVICILPVAQIAIGAVHLEDCPLQRYIPIYLIVSGAFGLLLVVVFWLPDTKSPEYAAYGPYTAYGVYAASTTAPATKNAAAENAAPKNAAKDCLSTLLEQFGRTLITPPSLFLFCWFIAGNVWIYSIYEPNYTRNSTNPQPYCDKTLYPFAFWTTTLFYIPLGLFLVGLVIFCCFPCGRGKPGNDQRTDDGGGQRT